jgi:flagellar hook-basal body protein
VGKGVSARAHRGHLFTQGSMQHTGVPTDLAIGGDGFFVVKGTQGGVTQNFFTRNGAFRFDDQGYMVNQSGYRVQGFAADPTGVLGATAGDLRVNKKNLDPLPTSNIDIHANLRPSDPIIPAPGFNLATPDTTSSFKTSMVTYDSLGNAHQVDVYGTHSQHGAGRLGHEHGDRRGGSRRRRARDPAGNRPRAAHLRRAGAPADSRRHPTPWRWPGRAGPTPAR